jgi:hypothetical protein
VSVVLMRQNIKTMTCRWLFYLSLSQLIVFFAIPVFLFPWRLLFYVEILAALTFGVILAIYFLGVNVYAFFIDTDRRRLYGAMTAIAIVWLTWAAVSWLFIEHMDYLLR